MPKHTVREHRIPINSQNEVSLTYADKGESSRGLKVVKEKVEQGSTADLNTVEFKNPKIGLPEKMLESMAVRRRAFANAIRERQTLDAQLRLSSEELSLRQRAQQKLVAQTGYENELQDSATRRRQQANRLRLNLDASLMSPLDIVHKFPPLDPVPVAGESELWWAQTTIYMPSRLGMTTFWQDDGLHITGALDQFDGDLWKGFLLVFAQFGLDPARMPPGNALRFISTPPVDLYGTIDGFTMGGPLDFGDHWAKCWLVTKQELYTDLDLGVPWLKLGYNSQETASTLVFLENDFDMAWNNLPGSFAMPSVLFDLTPLDRSRGIQVDLSLRFDFQLEGDGSQVRISRRFNGDSAVLRTYQWKIQPIG